MRSPKSPLRRALVTKGVIRPAPVSSKRPSAALKAAADSLNAIKPMRKP